MDTECNTHLEDDSPIEVSRALVRLYSVFRTHGIVAVEAELRTLPHVADWLDVVPEVRTRPPRVAEEDEDSDSDKSMDEEESEWTTVSYKKK